MSKIRINELARQLEVKSREVIDKLHELGIAEKVTHSSSIDEDKADQLRRYYSGEPMNPAPAAHRNGATAAVEDASDASSDRDEGSDHRRAKTEAPAEDAAAPAPPKRTRAVQPPA